METRTLITNLGIKMVEFIYHIQIKSWGIHPTTRCIHMFARPEVAKHFGHASLIRAECSGQSRPLRIWGVGQRKWFAFKGESYSIFVFFFFLIYKPNILIKPRNGNMVPTLKVAYSTLKWKSLHIPNRRMTGLLRTNMPQKSNLPPLNPSCTRIYSWNPKTPVCMYCTHMIVHACLHGHLMIAFHILFATPSQHMLHEKPCKWTWKTAECTWNHREKRES